MTLPAAVQKQSEAAAAMQKNLAGNPDQAPKETEQPTQPQTTTENAASEKPAQAPADDKENDAGYWKNRFQVLQGKYNKEVPALQNQLNDLNRKFEQMSKQPEPEKSYLSEDEREEYGEIGDLVERVARKAAEDATKPLAESAQRTSQSLYYQDLDALAPGWRDKNEDDGFNDWLDVEDSMAGRTRREMLHEAFASGNAKRTAQFFNAWGGANNAAAEKTPAPEQPSPLPESAGGEVPITEQRRWTSAEIKKFYDDKTRGVYQGREDEAAAIEREIFASQNGS